jgi:hypothetical protein
MPGVKTRFVMFESMASFQTDVLQEPDMNQVWRPAASQWLKF